MLLSLRNDSEQMVCDYLHKNRNSMIVYIHSTVQYIHSLADNMLSITQMCYTHIWVLVLTQPLMTLSLKAEIHDCTLCPCRARTLISYLCSASSDPCGGQPRE